MVSINDHLCPFQQTSTLGLVGSHIRSEVTLVHDEGTAGSLHPRDYIACEQGSLAFRALNCILFSVLIEYLFLVEPLVTEEVRSDDN
jgi:hypothetical protein